MLELNAVIFDMDGLMIDTEPVGKMLVKTSHEKFGYEITEEMFYHLIGTNERHQKLIIIVFLVKIILIKRLKIIEIN